MQINKAVTNARMPNDNDNTYNDGVVTSHSCESKVMPNWIKPTRREKNPKKWKPILNFHGTGSIMVNKNENAIIANVIPREATSRFNNGWSQYRSLDGLTKTINCGIRNNPDMKIENIRTPNRWSFGNHLVKW